MRQYLKQICLLEEPDRIRVKSPAKINLFLNVVGKRDDGYHEVENIMQTISLHDVIEIKRIPEGMKFTTDSADVPTDMSNFILQAAQMFFESAFLPPSVSIHLNKNIPVAAGLGGGSGNAAVTLLALNHLFGQPLTHDKLHQIASKIGSDAPFFLDGGTAICFGRGEKVQPLRSAFKFHGILLKPPVKVSTASIYNKFKLELTTCPERNNIVSHIDKGTYHQVLELCYNSLEETVFETVEGLERLKEILLQCGSSKVIVSGSGPTLFGFFDKANIRESRRKVEQLAGDKNFIIIIDSESNKAGDGNDGNN
jgi:4-diphosphocytidyl-2-C-methyl-D-erythritol kinase